MTYRADSNEESNNNRRASSVPCPDASALSGGCGRTPFLSDEECDRGSVDTSQFDDFPYCQPIKPVDPDIPPEIIEFPAPPPLPTFTCSCINIDYTFKIEYSDKFDTKTKFSSDGDCCDGMYDSEFDIEIKCPLPDAEAKVKVKLEWDDPQEGEAVVFRRNGDECELEVLDDVIEIGLPCPISVDAEAASGDANAGEMGIKLAWNAPDYGKEAFVSVDEEKCGIEVGAPQFNLGLPCPLAKPEDPVEVDASSIRYGGMSAATIRQNVEVDGVDSDVISFGRMRIVRNKETNEITTRGYSPQTTFTAVVNGVKTDITPETLIDILVKEKLLDAITPCEKVDAPPGGLALLGTWKGSNAVFSESAEKIVDIDEEKCELKPKNPCFILDIPCPIPSDAKEVEIKLDWKDKKTDRKNVIEKDENDEFGCMIDNKPVTFDLGLPCPIPDEEKEIKISIDWGDGNNYDQHPVIKKDDDDCSIDTELTEFNLQLPCPIPGEDKELKISIDWGNGKKSDQQAIIKKGQDDCSIDTETTEFNLNLPCPIESFDSKLFVKHGWDSAKITRSTLAEKGSNGCSIKLNSADVDYGVPWPVVGDGNRSIAIELRYEDGFMSDNHDFVDTSSKNHTMEFHSSTFKLAIPCPLDNLDVSVSRDESDSYDFGIEIENEEYSGTSGGKGGAGVDGRDCKKKLKVKQQLPSKHEVSVFTGVEFDCKTKKFIFKTHKIRGRFYMEEGEDFELEIPVSKHQRCPK